MVIHKNVEGELIKKVYDKATEIIKIDSDQDILLTGIEKSIEILKQTQSNFNKPKILLYLEYDDVDELYEYQTLLCKYQNLHKNIQFFMLFDDAILFKLEKGMNIIYLSNILFTGKGVGLLPIVKKASISTKGLKWDISIKWINQVIGKPNLGKK
jgi:hypothetical protein